MNIGKLDRKATIYSRTAGRDIYGSTTLTNATIAGYAWVKRINKKSDSEKIGDAFPVIETNLQFVSRYDTTTIKAGRYFTLSGDSTKYYIKGIEEIGREQGLLLTVTTQISRSA